MPHNAQILQHTCISLLPDQQLASLGLGLLGQDDGDGQTTGTKHIDCPVKDRVTTTTRTKHLSFASYSCSMATPNERERVDAKLTRKRKRESQNKVRAQLSVASAFSHPQGHGMAFHAPASHPSPYKKPHRHKSNPTSCGRALAYLPT